MAVIDLEIIERNTYHDGVEFGTAGAYERLDGIVTYAVDPDHEVNRDIVDLDRAPRDSNGKVRFSGDFTILKPVDMHLASGRAFVELPNRGRKLAPGQLNRAAAEVPPTANIPPGDGFLFRHGFVVAWIGWQWDVFRSEALMGLDAPLALDDAGEEIRGQAIVEIHPNEFERTRLLANRLHEPYPAADLNDPEAVLYVRDWEDGPDEIIPREQWQFAREEGAEIVPSNQHIYYEAGFEPGRIYHITYTAQGARVVGSGLLAARDIASFLKYETGDQNPVRGQISHAYNFGVSQTGRMQRHYLYLGLNTDEEGRQAYDGMLVHVAGGRRGEFNHRFGQPSVQPTPGFGHRFPFADTPLHDPLTGLDAGLLDKQYQRGGVPRIFYTNTSAEYWRGDGALLHIDPQGEHDLDNDENARIYHFAGTQHGPGHVPQTRYNTNDGSRGRYGFNTVDYTPLLRAALLNLDAWAQSGANPPASCHPRISDGSATSREAVLRGFQPLPNMHLPDPDRLPVLRTVDLGEGEQHGVGKYPAVEGRAYPALVAAIDEDGNETAGLRLPDLQVPLGTHTGWNPRDPETGAPEQIMSMQGASHWFAITDDLRKQLGDPRPAISERYQDRDDYLSRVLKVARKLADSGYVLDEDIEIIVADAAERWAYVIENSSH